MRKKLLFCSALLLSASLAGCGYNDDNVRETVPELPDKCTISEDCSVGSVGGQCVLGHCLRLCGNFEDCEEGTMCEGGVCRHIEDCPQMTLNTGYENYNNRKCLKVFSHVPTNSWVRLLKNDITFDNITTKEMGSSQDFTSKNFSFQLPNRALQGGLNYSIVVASALTFIVLENMASTALLECMRPDLSANNTDPKYAIPIDSNKTLSLGDDSLYSVCYDLGERDFRSDFNNIDDYMDRFNITQANLENKTYDQLGKCEKAYLIWATLDSVFKVISEATLQGTAKGTSGKYAIQWVLQLLSTGKATTKVATINDITNGQTPTGQNLLLPDISNANDIKAKMPEIHETICNDIMYSLLSNPMAKMLSTAHMDFVDCLSDTQSMVGPALVKNGFNFLQSLNLTGQHLSNVAMGLIFTSLSGTSAQKAHFATMESMVEAVGDPSFIWLTENNLQELNIKASSKKDNAFSDNALMLGINYRAQSADITNTPVTLEVYQTNDVNHDKPRPQLVNNDTPPLGSNPFIMNAITTSSVAGLLANKKKNDTYEFYLKPTIAQNQLLMCGGITLDISAIDGYVVLTEDDIKNRSGHAIILKKDE